jgi:hypothetical protein
MIAKFGYALFAGSAFLALLARRQTRAAFVRRESLLVLPAAAVVMAPFSYWLLTNQADLASMAHDALLTKGQPYFDRVLFGLSKLVENSFEFLMPWALIAGATVWVARRTGLRSEAPAGPGERLLSLILTFSILIIIAGVFAVGPTSFPSGYILPVLVSAIPYSACLLSRHVPDAVRAERFAALSISILVVIVLARLMHLSNGGFPESSYRREMWPIADLARELRDAGIDRGTMVTVSTRDAGNIRLELPEMRYVTAGQGDRNRPPGRAGDDVCWLLWNATEMIAPGERWAKTGDSEVAETLPQIAIGKKRSFDIPWAPSFLGNARTSRWSVVELHPDDPLCR